MPYKEECPLPAQCLAESWNEVPLPHKLIIDSNEPFAKNQLFQFK